MTVTPSREPCIACGKRETIGVAYGHPNETKFWCAACLPDEFRPKVRERSDQELFDAWADIEWARDRKAWALEARLREDGDG